LFLSPRDPSWHGLTVGPIRRAKGLAHIRLFVGTDEEGEADEQEEPVDDLWQPPEPDDIPNLDQQRADNHRVAEVVVQPVDDPFLWRVEWDRGAVTFADEIRHAPDDNCPRILQDTMQ